ncbi:MAG: ECF transporter S component [Ardenticatenales bacterium]
MPRPIGWAGGLTIALASAVGCGVLLAPLWPGGAGAAARAATAPALMGGIVLLCFGAAALEAGVGLGPQAVALLGALVAFNSVLRFVEVIVPGPGEFSPIFALVVLAGYAYGARFGFLTGSLTLVVSALITGGVGPWLPYQMLVAGWVGLTAGWLPGARRPSAPPRVAPSPTLPRSPTSPSSPHSTPSTIPAGTSATRRTEIVALALFGALWGIGYGVCLTLWDWQFREIGSVGAVGADAWRRFIAFYVATSLPFDAFRAAGNAALIALAGGTTLTMLRRLGRPFVGRQAGRQAVDDPGDALGAVDHSVVASEPQSQCQPQPQFQFQPPPTHRHPTAWLAWLASALALGSVTRNPLVLAEAWLAIAAVRAAAVRDGQAAGKAWNVGRWAPWVIASTALYNGLMAHTGDTVLLRLPAAWPLVGGIVTLEALLQGASNGLALIVLVAAFAAFEAALPTRALLTLVPRAFGSLAIVVAVALTGVPAIRRQLAEVREALALHGRTAGLRGWIAAAGPTLAGGLERAVHLAESLTARGLVGSAPPSTAARVAISGGLALVVLGGTGLFTTAGDAWLAALTLGLAATAAGIALAGRGARRTRWRPQPWRWADVGLVAAGAAIVGLAAWPAARETLAYSPYPRAAWPPLTLGAVGIVALLAVPALPVRSRRRVGWNDRARVDAGALDAPAATVLPVARTSAEIVCDGFRVSYHRRVADGADDLDLALAPISAAFAGGITLVAGPSGSGKSTLLRSIAGLVPHFTGGATAGRLRVAGRDPVALGPAAMSGLVGFVGDTPEAAFAVDGVADEVAFALEQLGWPADRIGGAVAGALEAAGVSALAGRAIETLSGGEAQRVAIAAALARAPAVLVLDEPTSQLDDANAAAVLQAIRHLADDGVTVVLSEHRLDRVLPHADRVVWLTDRSTPAFVVDPADARAVPALPALAEAPRALAFEGVTFSHGAAPLLRDVTFHVAPGEIVALMAPSGAGKTSLLRLAAGFATPSAGRILVAGADVAGQAPHGIARRLAYVPQSAGLLLVGHTVSEAIARAGRDGPAVAALLERLGVAHLTDRHPLDVSAGERQRIALALALADERPAVALDEPTRGLDALALARLVDALHDRCRAGAGVLVATHDRRLVAAVHRVVGLETP